MCQSTSISKRCSCRLGHVTLFQWTLIQPLNSFYLRGNDGTLFTLLLSIEMSWHGLCLSPQVGISQLITIIHTLLNWRGLNGPPLMMGVYFYHQNEELVLETTASFWCGLTYLTRKAPLSGHHFVCLPKSVIPQFLAPEFINCYFKGTSRCGVAKVYSPTFHVWFCLISYVL